MVRLLVLQQHPAPKSSHSASFTKTQFLRSHGRSGRVRFVTRRRNPQLELRQYACSVAVHSVASYWRTFKSHPPPPFSLSTSTMQPYPKPSVHYFMILFSTPYFVPNPSLRLRPFSFLEHVPPQTEVTRDSQVLPNENNTFSLTIPVARASPL